ncbi:hypothetical protein [Paenibacillus thiaminolyticus]|uniref:hypothetical protein n=1 Tax=Paenibacillus thiaminolyticus TaxID=49283 RepID=UPI000E6BA956|nr:hypothetical protein [Paenibacillus thiaminolyticus]
MEQIRQKIRSSKTLAGPFPPFHADDASEYPHDLFLEWFHEAANDFLNRGAVAQRDRIDRQTKRRVRQSQTYSTKIPVG